jgi:hypothetical protein
MHLAGLVEIFSRVSRKTRSSEVSSAILRWRSDIGNRVRTISTVVDVSCRLVGLDFGQPKVFGGLLELSEVLMFVADIGEVAEDNLARGRRGGYFTIELGK